jgi:hypothetical protein
MYDIKKELTDRENKPLVGILSLAVAIYLIGIHWGLPNTATWQVDSLAPFRPLKGMFSLYSFGYFHKYPFVHSFILSVLNFPIVAAYGIIYLLNGGVLDPTLFSEAILNSKTLATILTLEDRLVSVIMALGLIFNVFLITKKLFNRQSGFFAALFILLNQAINHNAHVAKVEIPLLFWATLTIYALIWAIETEEKKYYIYSALFSGFSYGSKDQGYAFFILPFLLVIIMAPLYKDLKLRKWNQKYWTENLLWFVLAFLGCLIIVENLVLNWSGFLLRIEHLTGDAGFRSASYPVTFLGYMGMLWDSFIQLNALITPVIVLFLGVGLVFIIKEKKFGFFYTLPLWVCLSFFLTFLMIIRQTGPRFIAPLAVFMAPYAGWGASKVYKKGKIIILILLLIPLVNTLLINYSMLSDPRYEMTKYMKEIMVEGDSLEYYSTLAHLPLFPEGVEIRSIKSPPENYYDLDKRDPDYIILSSTWYRRFVEKPKVEDTSFKYGTVYKKLRYEEQGYSKYFADLIEGNSGYHIIKRVDARPLTKSWLSISIPNHFILLEKN